MNKELWVLEEQGYLLGGWILFYLILSRSIGYRLDKWGATKYEEGMNRFKDVISGELKHAVEFRKVDFVFIIALISCLEFGGRNCFIRCYADRLPNYLP